MDFPTFEVLNLSQAKHESGKGMKGGHAGPKGAFTVALLRKVCPSDSGSGWLLFHNCLQSAWSNEQWDDPDFILGDHQLATNEWSVSVAPFATLFALLIRFFLLNPFLGRLLRHSFARKRPEEAAWICDCGFRSLAEKGRAIGYIAEVLTNGWWWYQTKHVWEVVEMSHRAQCGPASCWYVVDSQVSLQVSKKPLTSGRMVCILFLNWTFVNVLWSSAPIS